MSISHSGLFTNKTTFSKFCSLGNFGLEQSECEICFQQGFVDCKNAPSILESFTGIDSFEYRLQDILGSKRLEHKSMMQKDELEPLEVNEWLYVSPLFNHLLNVSLSFRLVSDENTSKQTLLEPIDHFNHLDVCDSSKLHNEDLFDMDHSFMEDNTCV
ncbi:hypothetical protein PNEG_03016 [Pneumocystis murina B123]|uniref:Uncharacterized protein n=1 Tax=Pneumocystis murina (strain B123) TaxID=1069680 RepID=M7P3U6_PNEMU|nr:hypothetical protein PNEG_03016 [Pneumocystis murina B123]EMR08535.1 hypothetical protein PNEG_03016 [Pneumocystis murina B123]